MRTSSPKFSEVRTAHFLPQNEAFGRGFQCHIEGDPKNEGVD